MTIPNGIAHILLIFGRFRFIHTFTLLAGITCWKLEQYQRAARMPEKNASCWCSRKSVCCFLATSSSIQVFSELWKIYINVINTYSFFSNKIWENLFECCSHFFYFQSASAGHLYVTYVYNMYNMLYIQYRIYTLYIFNA